MGVANVIFQHRIKSRVKKSLRANCCVINRGERRGKAEKQKPSLRTLRKPLRLRGKKVF